MRARSGRPQAFRIPTPDVERLTSTLDLFRQRRHSAEQARVQRELAAVVLLVCDAVVHPGQARARLAVEPADVLEHVQLAGAPQALVAVAVRRAQPLEESAARAQRSDAAGGLMEDSRL